MDKLVKKKRVKNPLIKRIPRELLGDWKKYLVVAVFLVFTIGFVSGMYVANGSMEQSADKSRRDYKLESGHFILKQPGDDELISAIETGEKADIRSFYTDKARKELDLRFEADFEGEFKKQFDSEFLEEFDSAFKEELTQTLMANGLEAAAAEAMLPGALSQAKESGDYQSVYDKAYKEAYDTAYQAAYDEAYNEAWNEVLKELDDKLADADEKYELNAKGFKAIPAVVYENYFKNEDEDNDNDGIADGTVRVYSKTEDINLACLMEGRFPETADEIAIDRMHADNTGLKLGERITVGGQEFRLCGLISYVNYYTLHEKSTDAIFDAIKFDVAMVTQEGFDRLESGVNYCYAFKYSEEPESEAEEKSFSDNFLKGLLTQTVTKENELTDYLPAYANPAINFATDDMGRDKVMGGAILDILTVIIAFVFAITIANTISKEAKVIGTLKASGYSSRELIIHYLSMPIIVTLLSAVIGNILGYTVFKNVVVSMYYNSYSLPDYYTVWSAEAFIKTTLIPAALMLAVNFIVIFKMMRRTPLQFLRHDLKKTSRKRAISLPEWSFMNRFRLRIILQNIPNYLTLFIGILFISIMLAMAVGMPDTLSFYKENAEEMMFSKYQYILNSHEAVSTANPDAERFSMYQLLERGGEIEEEVSVYGITDGSRYVEIANLNELKVSQVYISEPFAKKYRLSVGEDFSLDERFESKSYRFRIAGIYEKCQSLAVFMSMDDFRSVFDMAEDEFSGYLSDSEITDIDEENIATVITKRDITKMCDQLDHSFGSYMEYFQVLCILLSAALIYLLTKLIIEKNENAISMVKILGYSNFEIATLYLLCTTVVVIALSILCTFLGVFAMARIWERMMAGFSGWFSFKLVPISYLKIFAFIIIGYILAAALDFRRIKKIPMDRVLKNVE